MQTYQVGYFYRFEGGYRATPHSPHPVCARMALTASAIFASVTATAPRIPLCPTACAQFAARNRDAHRLGVIIGAAVDDTLVGVGGGVGGFKHQTWTFPRRAARIASQISGTPQISRPARRKGPTCPTSVKRNSTHAFCSNSSSMAAKTVSGISHSRLLASRPVLRALRRQATFRQMYAPRPDFLPVKSSDTLPSGARTTRSSSWAGLLLVAPPCTAAREFCAPSSADCSPSSPPKKSYSV